jgi:hypothetical protein
VLDVRRLPVKRADIECHDSQRRPVGTTLHFRISDEAAEQCNNRYDHQQKLEEIHIDPCIVKIVGSRPSGFREPSADRHLSSDVIQREIARPGLPST